MYIRVQPDGNIINPFTIKDLKAEFPLISFPANIPVQTLLDYGVHSLIPTERPEYDPITHKLVEGTPVKQKARNDDGTWKADDPSTPEDEAWEYVQVWELEPYTPEEVTSNISKYNSRQEALRAQAYRTESDPLYFKWKRGEATEQEWLDAVANVKSTYLDYNG